MYEETFVRNVVRTQVKKEGSAAPFLMSFLSKTENDLYHLFQNSPFGWELWRRMCKNRLVIEISRTPQFAQDLAVKDHLYDMYFDYIEVVNAERICLRERMYLTGWFSPLIMVSGPRSGVKEQW